MYKVSYCCGESVCVTCDELARMFEERRLELIQAYEQCTVYSVQCTHGINEL